MENSRMREDQPSDFLPEIRRGRIDRLTIYEISEDELENLARGSPSSIYLNFAIFLLSITISFIVTLLTVTINSDRVFTVFVVIAAVGAVSGTVLILLWFKNRRYTSDLIKTIRERLPPEGIQQIRNDKGY